MLFIVSVHFQHCTLLGKFVSYLYMTFTNKSKNILCFNIMLIELVCYPCIVYPNKRKSMQTMSRALCFEPVG